MEQDLLDISGEDEDYLLLKTTPKKGATLFAGGNAGRDKSYFNCSPLQIPRSSRTVHTRPPFSPIGRITGNSMEQPSPSIDAENVGKENTSGNKIELPKLSVERQRMKKKKKNAGFNLRKSLAWDRAFSTEEGVLDSAELSKITGNACQIGGDLLPVIEEEFKESMSASKYTSVSPGLRALEENLFNDLPVSTKYQGKKIVSGMLTKYGSPSKAQSSSAQKKVISAQDLRSGSKRSGCPRPPPSSSLKRPAYACTTTPHSRELSLSKVSSTKSDPLTVANNMKKTTQSPSKAKLCQPTQPKNSQRSLGSASFSKSTSSTKGKTKSSMASKSSIPKPSLKQARRNVISKTSEVPSESKSRCSVVGKSNVGPISSSDVVMLGHASNFPDSTAITMGSSLAQTSCSRVGNTLSAVSRQGKPSGLRAPSPSIGYFSKSNSQPSHSAGDKHSQLPRSDICSASRFSSIPTFKKPQVSEKVPAVNPKSVNGSMGSLGSAAGFSTQPPIILKPSQERVKVELKSTQDVEPKVSCCSKSSQIDESLQHPCIIQGNAGKLVLDDVAICTAEKIPTVKCEEFQSNGEPLALSCKDNVQDCNMSDNYRNEKRKSCCSVEENCASLLKHAPVSKDSMDSSVQGPSSEELTQLKVSNTWEEDIFTTNGFSGEFDTSDVDGQPLTICVHPGNEEDALIVYHSTENVAEQPEVLDSFTVDPAFLGGFISRKSDVNDLSSSENHLRNTESVLVPSGPAEAPDCVKSPCSHLEEHAVSNSILCDHNMVCDGEAVLETEKIIDVSDSTETNCSADLIGPFSDCKDWFRESEEHHFSCQLVPEVKETGHEIDDLTRNERAYKDRGPDMQIDYITGSPDPKQNMEQVKLLTPSSMEMKPLESSEEPFTEKLASEKQEQDNCSSIANTSDVKNGCVMQQTAQLGTSDGCSPAKDASPPVLSYSNEEFEDNSELEDMDLVTESDCSDEEPDYILERKEVDLVIESELIGDLDEFDAKGILNQEYPEVESIHTAPDLCGKPKTLLSESVSSSASIFEDSEHLNENINLFRNSEGMAKEDSKSVCIEHDSAEKAKSHTDTGKDFSAQVTDQELGSHEEEEVQVIKNSPEPVAFATREEESGTPMPMNETYSVRDDMQSNEFNVVNDDDTLTPESNGGHASENSSSCTCASEDKNKMIRMDAKLEKTPNPIVIKPPNAVPFSDEWLAAIEAAGEDILSQKSGRVQHSPTDKTTPEPGPWSPVKRKNNHVVGPFDCTKYTNKDLPPVID